MPYIYITDEAAWHGISVDTLRRLDPVARPQRRNGLRVYDDAARERIAAELLKNAANHAPSRARRLRGLAP